MVTECPISAEQWIGGWVGGVDRMLLTSGLDGGLVR